MVEALWADLVRPGGLIVEPLGSGIFRLSEAALCPTERSFFYLVHGEAIDCLIDGGWGFCSNLKQCIPLGAGELHAVATHSHYDHIGHLAAAERRYGHPAEAGIFAHPEIEATQAWPFLVDRPSLADGGVIDVRSIRQTPCALTDHIGAGDTIDLGGRVLRVFHTPGHSPGSISLLDDSTRSIFCGDVILEGEIYDEIPGADKADLVRSHELIAALPSERLLGGHGAILDRAAALARIARYREAVGL